jgi:hypothetical protein
LEQSVVEVQDTGEPSTNRDAAQRLAESWLAALGTAKGIAYRFVDTEPFVAVSERPKVEPDTLVIPLAPIKPVVQPIR